MKQTFFHTTLVALLMLMPMAARGYDFCADNIYYNIQEDGTLCVTYARPKPTGEFYNGDYSGNVVIPATVTHDGITRTVTAVGVQAFCNSEGMNSVNLPATVTTIGDYAFAGCTHLSTVNIPSGVDTLGNGVFNDYRMMASIELPATLKAIGNRCFHGSGLTSIDLPRHYQHWRRGVQGL